MERKSRKWDRGGGEEISFTYSLYGMADVLLSLVSSLLLFHTIVSPDIFLKIQNNEMHRMI